MTITLIPAHTTAEIPVTFTRTASSQAPLDSATIKAYRVRDDVAVGGYLELAGPIEYPDADTAVALVVVPIPDDEPGGLQIIRCRLDTPTWAAIEKAIYVEPRSAPPPES